MMFPRSPDARFHYFVTYNTYTRGQHRGQGHTMVTSPNPILGGENSTVSEIVDLIVRNNGSTPDLDVAITSISLTAMPYPKIIRFISRKFKGI